MSPSLAVGRVCDVISLGTSFDPAASEWADCEFFVFEERFRMLLDGTNLAVNLIMEDLEPIFHEGPVLFDDALFFTTNRLGNMSDPVWGSTAPAQFDQYIEIKKLDLGSMELSTVRSTPVDIPMANGMTKTPDGQNILVLSQGFNLTGGAIYEMDRNTYEATAILDTFYGSNFNALNDIKATSDGIIFFSDPVYGFERKYSCPLVYWVPPADRVLERHLNHIIFNLSS
jgi:sugar lactone lactonase YvrE